MNKLIPFAVAGLLSAAATAQTAQPAPPIEAVRITAASERIDLPPLLHNMYYDQFDEVDGTYSLSDGRVMQLSLWGNRMYARIDGMPRSQIVAESPYVFVALDRQMKITTEPQAYGSRAVVLLKSPQLAGAPAGFTRLLAYR